jgi:hypothetical protein
MDLDRRRPIVVRSIKLDSKFVLLLQSTSKAKTSNWNTVFLPSSPNGFVRSRAKLVESNVDVIVAVNALSAVMLKQATSTIPIVFVLVASLENRLESIVR